ncbi:MAG TPA: divergent polysaccharide deacetylase family protein [Candidatus Syntrophosphaera thermopropionivorans]|nr:divergent polysaccharide deacetylase family protein [Candidatus Syntrophosphaera thermopropionivorans]
MEKTILIVILVLGLMLFSCTSKPKTEPPVEKTETEHPESYTENQKDLEPEKTTSSVDITKIKSYKYTWSKSDIMPPIAIIIDDFGQYSGKLLEDFTSLPKEIAFAILPDLPHTQTVARLADKTGHQVLIHIPMQAIDHKANPGKRYIKSGMEQFAIADLLQDFYAQIPNALAANNHMGSEVTSDLATMSIVLEELKELGIFFLDSATTNKSATFTAAENLRLITAKRDIFLDVPDNSDKTIINKIEGLSKFKGRNQPIVIITHCHNREKLVALEKFLDQIDDMGIQLISVSQLYQKLGAPA